MKSIFTSLISALLLPASIYTASTVNAAPEEELKNNATKKYKIPEYGKPTKISDRFEKIISHGSGTMIPKGVILYLPDAHKSKVVPFFTKAEMVPNNIFFAKNKNLIHIIQLTKEQTFAAKNKPRYEIPYETFEDLKKLGRIIICTYNNSPVRVKVEPKPAK